MNAPFDWRDMLRFDKMIAPTFLTILYYLLVVGVVLAGLKIVFEGMDSPYYGSKMVMGGLALAVIGPFVVRLYIELLIVIFRIYTRLTNIEYSLRGQVPPIGIPDNQAARPQSPAPVPSGHPGNSIPMPYPAGYQAYEQATPVRLTPRPTPEPVSQPPIGFQIPAPEPTPPPASPAEQPLQNFWSPGDSSSPFSEPRQVANPIPPVDLNKVTGKIPNWPAMLASVIVLYAVISPYAVLSYDGSSALGQLLGVSYSIKHSSLGILVVLAALVMIGTSAGGLKWLWFVSGFGITLLGSVVAFLEEGSMFSQLSKVKTGMAAAGSALGSAMGQFMPQGEQIAGQMSQHVPDASQFLNNSFYLFILAMVFLGYWALGGQYQERGFMTGNNA